MSQSFLDVRREDGRIVGAIHMQNTSGIASPHLYATQQEACDDWLGTWKGEPSIVLSDPWRRSMACLVAKHALDPVWIVDGNRRWRGTACFLCGVLQEGIDPEGQVSEPIPSVLTPAEWAEDTTHG